MDVQVKRDSGSGVTTVALSGALTAGSAGEVLATLLKSAAECPAAVLVEVGDVRLGEGARPEVFATAFHRGMRGHGVPILIVGADPVLAGRLAGFRTFVHAYSSRGDALRALGTWVPRWRHQCLAPVPASVARARAVVGDGCLSWGLMHLRESARLVMSELADNAIRHTGRPFEVMVSYTGVFLRLAVQDPSPDVPRPAGADGPGRGLRVVTSLATHWGTFLVPGGKVVWALLRAYPTADPEGVAGP